MRLGRLLRAACLLVMASAHAADLSVIGGWSQPIGSMDLASGAGTDIRSPIESASSQAQISITNTGGGPWTLMVRRLDSTLPVGVDLAVRRTTSGSGGGSLVGGESYMNVTATEQALFSGTGDRGGIGIQLRLDGLSIRQAPGPYDSPILYRIE